MTFIDTHCHFDFPPFAGDELNSLQLAEQAGIKGIIVVGTTAQYFSRILQLSQFHRQLFPALGLHPLWWKTHRQEDLQQLERLLAQRQEIIAIGEIGLDFFDSTLKQQAAFQQQLLLAQFALAKIYRLPVILHSRKSHDTLAKLLRQSALPAAGVVHGFSGSYQQAKAFIDLGYTIGVGGSITYSRANKTRQTIAKLPLDALLLETDAPDMPLSGYQGQANRPERVVEVWQQLCALRSEPSDKIREVLWQNTLRTFPKLSLVD